MSLPTVTMSGIKLRRWQKEAMRGIMAKRHGCIVAHRRRGKSYLLACLIFRVIMECELDSPRGAFIAPFRNQAARIVWRYLLDLARPLGGRGRESDLTIIIPGVNGDREIWLLGADRGAYERIRGLYLDIAVIDESAQMPEDAWSAVLRPALADRRGKAVISGTARGHDELYARMQYAMENPDEWFLGIYPYIEGEEDAIPYEEAMKLKAEMTDDDWAREMLCDFNVSVDNVILTLKLINESAKRELGNHSFAHAPIIIGVDGARMGKDESVIYVRQGLQTLEMVAKQGLETVALSELIASKINEHKPAAVFIDEGYNPGVIDLLRSWGYQVTAVNFGGKALNERFANKSIEMWVAIRTWMESGGSIPNDMLLINQLAMREFGVNNSGKMFIQEKKELKKSPDRADALALTFAYPVHAPSMELALIESRISGMRDEVEDYNPLEGL